MEYSLPYILFVIIILGISAFQLGMPLENNTRKYINYLVVILYIFFWGYRGFIATDWVSYFSFFKNLPTDIFQALNNANFEVGFVSYSAIIKYFSNSYEIFQLINTLTNVFLLHFFFKKYLPTKYYAFGFAVFLAFNGCILEMNLLRNFKALLIFLLALQYIEERKPVKYFILMFLALSFHWSSIVFFPLYFFLHKRIPLIVIISVIIVGSFIYLLQIEYIIPLIKALSSLLPHEMTSKVLLYLNSAVYAKSYGFTFGFFERLLTAFFVLYYYKRILTDKKNVLFINSFFVFITLFLYFSEVTIVLQRVAGNFAFSYWILIPIIIQQTERNIKPFVTVLIAILLISKIYLITNMVVYEYDSFLFGKSKSYEQRWDIFQKNKKIIENK
jgi:hypothetical protein